MVSVVRRMETPISTIQEETYADTKEEDRHKLPSANVRNSTGPNTGVRSSTSSLLSTELLNASFSATVINFDDLPEDENVENRVRRRKHHSDAKERLHSSMTSLEGFSPAELKEEVSRRRAERSHQRAARAHLAASMSNPMKSCPSYDSQMHSSMPLLASVNFSLDPPAVEVEVAKNKETENIVDTSMISTRNNRGHLWQAGVDCFGALELSCYLEFDYRAPLTPLHVPNRESIFEDCLKTWKEQNLDKEFVQACESVPVKTTCCGMVSNDDETIKDLVKDLQKGWVKKTNARLKLQRVPFKLDVFLWSWHNATGKTKTNILLIRFLSARR